MKIKTLIALCFSIVLVCTAAENSVPAAKNLALVADGVPKCEIVIPAKYIYAEFIMAQELQNWMGEITGTHIPVVKGSVPPAAPHRIFIGTSFAKEKYSGVLRKLRNTDAFAVRYDGSDIYLFGSIPRGTFNAVYAFLEQNSDIIWPRPEPGVDAVFGKNKTFTADGVELTEIPKTRYRGLQWTCHSPDTDSMFWDLRTRQNRNGDKLFGGMFANAGFGHGVSRFVDFEKNPEYFPMKDGKRTKTGQLCFLAYGMIPEFVQNLEKHLAERFPGVHPRSLKVEALNVSIGDGWGVCTCPACIAPFTTEDGKVIQPDDPAFRSAQYYTFINKVARELKKKYPRVVLGVYAYVFTSQPPPFQLEKNIRVQFCPFVRDEKSQIYDDTKNRNWHQYLDEWSKSVSLLWIRDYFGYANVFPRPLEYTVQRDFCNYYLKNKVLEFSTEWPVDRHSTRFPTCKQIWDSSAMTAWLITRLWWNPEVDLEQLRDYYLKRTYREAAPAMRKYHDTIRDAYYASPLQTCYSDHHLPMVKEYIVKPGNTENCRAALDEALAKVVHPVSKELIARQKKMFEEWIEQVKNDKTPRLTVPYSGEKDPGSFDSKAWENAASTGKFVVCDTGHVGETAKFRSEAKLIHDRTNLYIWFDCYADDMDTLKGNVSPQDGMERGPRGDIMEFFLGDSASGTYYQYMFDCGNPGQPELDIVLDANGYNAAWNGIWTRNIRRDKEKWSAIVTIPLENIGVNVTQNNKLLFQPIRGKYYQSADAKGKPKRVREMASWTGGWVHQMASFGELTLENK